MTTHGLQCGMFSRCPSASLALMHAGALRSGNRPPRGCKRTGEGTHPSYIPSTWCIHIFLAADVLHILEFGVDHQVLGNVLFHLVYNAQYIRDRHSPKERLEAVWARIVRQYRGRDTPSQLNNLWLNI